MQARKTKIIKTASDLFMRYGFHRTTLTDIAKETGISRPVLYANFADKHEVLGAVVEQYNLDVIEEIKAAWAQSPALLTKLDIFCEMGVLRLFDLCAQWPDAEQILAPENQIAANAYDVGIRRFIALVETEFVPFEANILAHGQTVAGYADFFVAAALKLKKNTSDRLELEAHLKALCASALAICGAANG